MRTPCFASAALCAALALSASVTAQSDPIFLQNGSEAISIYGDPSIGSPAGTFPPDYLGDMFWKAIPGEALLCDTGIISLNGIQFTLGDTDFATSPDFHDMVIGNAIDSAIGTGLNPGSLEPEFFSGTDNGTWISLGPSGLGPTSCAPVGSLFIFDVRVTFGTPLVLPCDGQTNTSITYFLPGGMTFTGGACGQGDYITQGSVSTDEHQYDIIAMSSSAGPASVTDGRQQTGSGPVPEPASNSIKTWLSFTGPVMNARVSDLSFGAETGLAGLWLSVGSGAATIEPEVSYRNGAIFQDFAVCAAAAAPAPPGGFPTAYGTLMLIPDPIFNLTSSAWLGQMSFLLGGRSGFRGAPITIPVSAGSLGLSLHLQGFAVDLTAFTGMSTNVFKCQLLP